VAPFSIITHKKNKNKKEERKRKRKRSISSFLQIFFRSISFSFFLKKKNVLTKFLSLIFLGVFFLLFKLVGNNPTLARPTFQIHKPDGG
jgi:intein/homing endonuclease